MSNETTYKTVLTQKAVELQSRALLHNEPILLKSIVLGDGNGEVIKEPTATSSIVNKVWEGSITNKIVDENSKSKILLETYIPANEGDFFIREIGVMTSEGELFAIGNLPESFKPKLTSGVGEGLHIRLHLHFNHNDKVEIVVDDSSVYATRSFVHSQVESKAEKFYVEKALKQKVNQHVIDQALDVKVDEYTFYEALEEKADKESTFADLRKKANSTFVEASLSKKANKSYVDEKIKYLSPTGSIITWLTEQIPDGYLECAGTAVSRSTYAKLFSVIGTRFGSGNGSTTFNLPDFRGEFLRGWDHGRGVDKDRVLGVGQTDDVKKHSHNLQGSAGAFMNPTGTGVQGLKGDTTSSYFKTSSTGNNIGSETRPRNIAVMYCIKY